MQMHRRTWYNLEANISIGPGFLHKAGYGKILFPHPPIVNWLLRIGLTKKSSDKLSLIHEYGHLQSAPFYLIYTIFNLTAGYVRDNKSIFDIIVVLICTHATWELISETYTYFDDHKFYRDSYTRISAIPRTVFWLFGIALTITGWVMALH